MVVHGNVQEPPGVDQLPRYCTVVRAWRWVAAWVVVRHDDSGRAEGDREPKHFTRMHQGGIEYSARHFLNSNHARLGVERNHVEHLYQFPRCALAQEVYAVLRSPDYDRLRL